MNDLLKESLRIKCALDAQRGTRMGIAVKRGQFAVVESYYNGRRTTHTQRSPWQSYAQCIDSMRAMLEPQQ